MRPLSLRHEENTVCGPRKEPPVALSSSARRDAQSAIASAMLMSAFTSLSIMNVGRISSRLGEPVQSNHSAAMSINANSPLRIAAARRSSNVATCSDGGRPVTVSRDHFPIPVPPFRSARIRRNQTLSPGMLGNRCVNGEWSLRQAVCDSAQAGHEPAAAQRVPGIQDQWQGDRTECGARYPPLFRRARRFA
jgi:hypothetical protein